MTSFDSRLGRIQQSRPDVLAAKLGQDVKVLDLRDAGPPERQISAAPPGAGLVARALAPCRAVTFPERGGHSVRS